MNLPSIAAAIAKRRVAALQNQAPDLSEIKDFVLSDVMGPHLRHVRLGTVKAQGTGNTITVAGTGESVADGANYPLLLAYTSSTVGGAGGPAVGHTVAVLTISPGNELVLGHVVF